MVGGAHSRPVRVPRTDPARRQLRLALSVYYTLVIVHSTTQVADLLIGSDLTGVDPPTVITINLILCLPQDLINTSTMRTLYRTARENFAVH